MQAGPGQMAQLDLRAMWLSRGDSVRVRVDGGEETLLQGTVLPPPESGGRRFRSKAAGNVTLVMVAGELTSLLFASFAVRAVCVTAGGCGGHGDCVGGSCRCSGHYRGLGALCLRSTSSCAPPTAAVGFALLVYMNFDRLLVDLPRTVTHLCRGI